MLPSPAGQQIPMTTPGMQGEVSPESMGKTASSAVEGPPDAKTGHFRNDWEHRGTKSVKPCTGKPFELSNESDWKVKKEIPDYYSSGGDGREGPAPGGASSAPMALLRITYQ